MFDKETNDDRLRWKSPTETGANKAAIRKAWRFDSQYFSRQRNRLVVCQRNELTGATRELDANTGRTLPRR